MTYYYIALATKSHAFYLEQKMRMENIQCELAYMPREIMTDLCNMGVKIPEFELSRAASAVNRCGLPGCRFYKEIVGSVDCRYEQVVLN